MQLDDVILEYRHIKMGCYPAKIYAHINLAIKWRQELIDRYEGLWHLTGLTINTPTPFFTYRDVEIYRVIDGPEDLIEIIPHQ